MYPRSLGRGRRALLAMTAGAVALGVLAGASPALAEGSSWWRLNSTTAPTILPHKGPAQIVVTAADLGDGEVNASETPIIITDKLPPGVTPKEVVPEAGSGLLHCPAPPLEQEIVCSVKGKLAPYEPLSIRIVVEVEEPAQTPSQRNIFEARGGQPGQTPPATLEKPLTLEKTAGEGTPFGVESYALAPEGENGAPATQAGSHPFQLTTTLDLNQALVDYDTENEQGLYPSAPKLPDNLRFKLPPGLVANTTAMPRCSSVEFATIDLEGSSNGCPGDTAVGVVNALVNLPVPLGLYNVTVPLFNLEPSPGEPARFGFVVREVPIVLDASLPAGGDYAAEVSIEDTDQAAQLLSSQVTVWGVPGDPRHDASRGWECLLGGKLKEPPRPCPAEQQKQPTAFLTLPTACEPLQSSVSGDSWPTGEPGNTGSPLAPEHTEIESPPTVTGCDTLAFDPSLELEPESHSASTPTGLNVGVAMPQPGLLTQEGRAEAALKQTTVRLPPGLQLNPSAANALEDCTAREFDFLNRFGDPFEGAEEEQQTGNETFPTPFSIAPPGCQDAAKVGTVQIATPLVGEELTGSVYLAAQNTKPFKSPLALYLLAENRTLGVKVKLAGSIVVEPDGQIVSTFANTPRLPFTSLKLHLFGGERAPQSTPPACGPATTTSEFVPWSGQAATHPESTFQVTAGVGGGPCPPSPLQFTPGFSGGVPNPQAGAYSPLVLHIARPDGQQALNGITLHLPPGEAATLAHATPCPEPPAGQEWACGAGSLLGHAIETAGLGHEPVTLTGEVFLTTGYDGAPFGALVRTHAAVGPFDLGWVNVRSRIDVDEHTAVASITTDPGPRDEAIPTMLDGVPVQLQALEVVVDRSEFSFNPTNCSPMSVTGVLNGSEGAADPLSYPFDASNCAGLPFHPGFTANTKGQASKANGASLVVKVTSAGLGQANIAKTTVTLPKALPSRLTTIQKACLAAVFESNPASCPEGSNVGSATIRTPIFANPLSGPAYLVSHGGAAFPDVEFVLTGEGVKIILDGQTRIKKGVTTATFNAVPDAPFTSFETVLPTGPHSALTANVAEKKHYSLCGQKLQMPTVITAQNGKVIEQNTKIAIQGCKAVKASKTKKLTRKQKLRRALKACRKHYKRSPKKRAACARAAHKRYAAKKASHRKPAAAGRRRKRG